jgi:hypothetical protein
MEHDMNEDIKELFDHFYLVGTAWLGGPKGVLVVTPGEAAVAIPESIRWAREFSAVRPEASFWGIYAGATGHDKWMRWRWLSYRTAGAHSVYVKSGAAISHPVVTLAKQPKKKGWPARLFRVAGPVSPDGQGEWAVPSMICRDPSIRYPRAFKSMKAIIEAVELDAAFVSAFRHGA